MATIAQVKQLMLLGMLEDPEMREMASQFDDDEKLQALADELGDLDIPELTEEDLEVDDGEDETEDEAEVEEACDSVSHSQMSGIGGQQFRKKAETMESGFTGVKQDSMGRKQYYRDGVHVAGPSEQEKEEIEKGGQAEAPAKKQSPTMVFKSSMGELKSAFEEGDVDEAEFEERAEELMDEYDAALISSFDNYQVTEIEHVIKSYGESGESIINHPKAESAYQQYTLKLEEERNNLVEAARASMYGDESDAEAYETALADVKKNIFDITQDYVSAISLVVQELESEADAFVGELNDYESLEDAQDDVEVYNQKLAESGNPFRIKYYEEDEDDEAGFGADMPSKVAVKESNRSFEKRIREILGLATRRRKKAAVVESKTKKIEVQKFVHNDDGLIVEHRRWTEDAPDAPQ